MGTSESGAFIVDELVPPRSNPWDSHLRLSAFDFLSDGRAVIASMSGDVWLVEGIQEELSTLRWRRFATGLNQPLGLVVVDDVIYVNGRDQITRLHDLDGDGHADRYENFNNVVMAATNFHAFNLNLEVDSQGRFLWAKSTPWPTGDPAEPADAHETTPHHGVLFRLSPNGEDLEIRRLATGPFTLILPEDNIFDCPQCVPPVDLAGGPYEHRAISDGLWVYLPQGLEPGEYTLEFGVGSGVPQDITYELIVV